MGRDGGSKVRGEGETSEGVYPSGSSSYKPIGGNRGWGLTSNTLLGVAAGESCSISVSSKCS